MKRICYDKQNTGYLPVHIWEGCVVIAKTTKIMEEAFKAHNWNYNIDEHPSGKNSALITGFDLK